MVSRIPQRQRIKDVLDRSMIPMDVENVRVGAGLKNWESTKALLLEMTLQGVIHAQKTTKSWIFWTNPWQTGSSARNSGGEPQATLTPAVVPPLETNKDLRR
jgi:hypothetical protein